MFKSVLILTLLVAFTAACASKKIDQEVDQQAADQPARPFHGGVALKGMESINSSTTLTAEQKRKLNDLHGRMMAQTFAIQEETSQLKSLLFETLTAPKYDKTKVETVKRKLVKLNNQKMDGMFKALDEAEKILGYVPPTERQKVFENLLFEDRMATR